jgi:hypothetical protein
MSGISSSGQQAAGRTALTPPQQHVLATLTETKKLQQFGNECFESFDDKKPIKNAFKNTPPGFGPGTLFFWQNTVFFTGTLFGHSSYSIMYSHNTFAISCRQVTHGRSSTTACRYSQRRLPPSGENQCTFW